jgi:hypothetical protein
MFYTGQVALVGLSALAHSYKQGYDRMSKFLDRMEQISRGTQAPLGFGVARPEKIPGMALVGLITSNHPSGVSTVADLAPDAALVAGGPGQASASELAEPLGAALPWGVRATSMTQEEVQAYQESGCDLLAFPLEGTPVSAVASDEIARILCVDPDINERQLRAIMALPVDMLLLSMSGHSGPWTLSELAAVGSVSRRAGEKYILVEVSQPPDGKELEVLRDIGVHGLVVDVGHVTSDALAGLKKRLLEMPRQRPGRKGRRNAIVPSSAFLSVEVPGREEEEDDDE